MEKKSTTIQEELIRKQLDLILSCEEIRNSPVLAKFLEFVVQEKLKGHEDEIKEYTIGVKALGRPFDFNPQLDAIVRIHAGRLRRIIFQYYQSQGKEDPIIINMPKGTYIPHFELRYIEKEGLHSEGSAIENESSDTDAKLIHNDGLLKPILAVMPFHNLSSENSKDYFVAGIGEQLSIDLARFQNISVISYYSTLKYESALKDLQEMKRTINLDYILTGSVRFINEIVRLNAQMILAENGAIIWTETYSRHFTPNNIFDIQEDIADQVLNAIADDNGVIIKKNIANASPLSRTENLTVQDVIYQYYDYTSTYDRDKFKNTFTALENAIKIEPNNSLIHAMLADMYIDVYLSSVLQEPIILENATKLARLAINLDEHLQHAKKAFAWCLLLAGEKEASMDMIEQCLNLNPKSASMISSMGFAYICLGEYRKGFNCLLKSTHLNPAIPASTKIGFALYYYHNNNFTESLRWLSRMDTVEVPFLTLFNQAIQGKLNKVKAKDGNGKIPKFKEQTFEVFNRIIYDSKLKNELMMGVQLSGLSVN
jgi:TolB-like protein